MPKGKSNNNKGSKSNGKAVKMQQPNRSRQTNAPNQGNAAPYATFKERRVTFNVSAGSKPGSIRIRAQDFMGQASWTTAYVAGSTLLNILVCPGGASFVNTRLGNFAKLYDKYCFKNLKFHVQTAAPTNSAGSYILSYDTDVSDPTPPASVDAIRQFLAHAGSRMGAAWESISIDCSLSDEQKFFYTSPASQGDERLTYQGQIYLAVASPVITTHNMNLWLEYDIELYDPQLETTVVESVIGATGGTTDSGVNQGWNSAITNTLVNAIVPPITNAAGDRGFSVPPGSWLVEQALSQSSAGGNTIQSPTIYNEDGSAAVAGTISALNTAYATLVAAASANGWRSDKVVNPGPGNLHMFGNYSTNGETIGAQLIKILEQNGSSFI